MGLFIVPRETLRVLSITDFSFRIFEKDHTTFTLLFHQRPQTQLFCVQIESDMKAEMMSC